jgi:hypothetical protein
MVGTIFVVALGLFVLAAIVWFVIVEVSAHKGDETTGASEPEAAEAKQTSDEDPMDLVPPRG